MEMHEEKIMSQYKDKDFIEMFIPSPEVKELIYKNNRIFSDREKAAIIWNSKFWLEEKLKGLEELKARTDDQKLICQIDERISYENDAMKLFKESNEGFVYILTTYDGGDLSAGDIIGYYKTFQLAWKEGIDESYGMNPYEIKKCQLIYDEDSDRIQAHMLWPNTNGGKPRYYAESMNFYEWSAGKMLLNERGQIYSFESNELSIDRFSLVNNTDGSRFEYTYVDIPNPFKRFDIVENIGFHADKDKHFGMVTMISNERKADEDGEKVVPIFSDGSVSVLDWTKYSGSIESDCVSPINLTKANIEHCNCFDHNRKVIVGHDYGAAVWIQPVVLDDVDKLMQTNVHEVGMKISVHWYFFDRILKDVFLRYFDPELDVNKKRYTKGFGDGGRFVEGYESNSLEPNFFTYDNIQEIIRYYRENVGTNDFNSLNKILQLLEEMMRLSPEAQYISLMS